MLQEKAAQAAAIKKDAYNTQKRISAKRAADMIELQSRGKPAPVSLALSDLFEQEGRELAVFGSLRNRIAACDAKLVGYIIASDLKMEKKISSFLIINKSLMNY